MKSRVRRAAAAAAGPCWITLGVAARRGHALLAAVVLALCSAIAALVTGVTLATAQDTLVPGEILPGVVPSSEARGVKVTGPNAVGSRTGFGNSVAVSSDGAVVALIDTGSEPGEAFVYVKDSTAGAPLGALVLADELEPSSGNDNGFAAGSADDTPYSAPGGGLVSACSDGAR